MNRELINYGGRSFLPSNDDKFLDVASKGIDLIRMLFENDYQIARMENERKYATKKMKYDYLRETDVPGRFFDERKEALQRAYDVLDKATATDDHELMKASLDLIGKIVSDGTSSRIEKSNYLPNY